MIKWDHWDRLDALIQSAIFAAFWAAMILLQMLTFMKLTISPTEVRTELRTFKVEVEEDHRKIKGELSTIRQFINEHAGRKEASEMLNKKGL